MVILVCITAKKNGFKIYGFLIYVCLNFMSRPDVNYFEHIVQTDVISYKEKCLYYVENTSKGKV